MKKRPTNGDSRIPAGRRGIARAALLRGVNPAVSLVLAVGLCLLSTGSASGQSVTARASSNRVMVGDAVSVDVVIANPPDDVDAPVAPVTNDFTIRFANRGEHSVIDMTRRTQVRQLIYSYECRPTRPGQLEIPPFTVQLGGREVKTRPLTIFAVKGPAGPFVLAEIKAPAGPVYVGQTIDLTLELWIRQFNQPGYALDANALYSFFLEDAGQCTLGVFAQSIQQRISYRPARRADDDGVMQDFFVYLIPATFPLTRAGMLDLGAIDIRYGYPLSVNRFLLGRYARQRTLDIRVTPTLPELHVRAVPDDGRPADFNGAVGRFRMRATAKPATVPVGDPITLTLVISGEGDLERLGAPRLDRVTELTRDFEVPTETLAGSIEGRSKLFSMTIRALREDVSAIPAIPFSFFDPDSERFETVTTDPIPLKVLPAQRIEAATLLDPGATGASGPLEEVAGGLLANYADPREVLVDQRGVSGAATWSLVGAMPALYLVTLLVQRRRERFRGDDLLRRRSQALRHALAALASDRAGTSVDQALLTYVADRCGAPAGGLTRPEAVELIRKRGAPEEIVNELDGLLTRLEWSRYGGSAASASGEDAATACRRLIEKLERTRLS